MYLFTVSPFVLLALALSTHACTQDEHCSLNGICTSGTCICDPGWTGTDCGCLDLAPARRGTGYNQTAYTSPNFFKQNGNSSWGGAIFHDREDSALFHLFVDQFSHGCGLSGWRPTSFVARAESRTGPQGPYHWVQNVTGSFRHNTYVHWSEADRKYLLWTIGVDVPDPTSCKSVNKKDWPNNISVSAADDIRGPWSKPRIVINGTNPAPWPLYTASDNTNSIALVAEDFNTYTAPRWDAEFAQIPTIVPWNTSDYSPTWTEDPFIWRDKRGNWHALAHWMIDIVQSNGTKYPHVGAHMFSRSLAGPWEFKVQEAFSSNVSFIDGSAQVFKRRERPKLFFSEEGDMVPLYLITGVQEMEISTSWTLIQPVGTRWREFEEGLGFGEEVDGVI